MGMRTFLMLRPFGRRQVAVTSPMGSGIAAISSMARAIDSTRFSSSASRSSIAAESLALRPAFSQALAFGSSFTISGYSLLTIQAQEPEGTTTCAEPEKSLIVRRTIRAASRR